MGRKKKKGGGAKLEGKTQHVGGGVFRSKS